MNAKQEFIEHTFGKEVLCAQLYTEGEYDDDYLDRMKTYYNLPVDYTAIAVRDFLNSLDFDYDSGYGGQELFGFIWYKDGTWSERGEYDGSEWWVYKSCPSIPNELRKEN